MTALTVASFIDLEHQIIPDVITLPSLGLGLLLSGIFPFITFLDSAMRTLVGGGIFYAIALLYRGDMGGGDIKLIAMIGSFIGLRLVLLTIFVAAFSGSLVGMTLIAFKGKGRKMLCPSYLWGQSWQFFGANASSVGTFCFLPSFPEDSIYFLATRFSWSPVLP